MRLGRVARRIVGEVLPRLGVRRRRRIGDFEVAYTVGRGFGVFATRPYDAEDFLLAITGRHVAARGEFTIQIGPDAHVDPAAPLRFANHSCDPNAGIRTAGDLWPALHARRPIAPGEEITWDYAMAEADFTVRGVPSGFRCRCGASSCRGRVADGWQGLPLERRRQYEGWVMPHLRASHR
jgi:uncharacterized protein